MNEFQQNPYSGGLGMMGAAYAPQQLGPQGLLGGLFGGPLGGLVGRGIGGIFGNPGMGSHIGQMAGGIGGALLPFGMDPMTAAAYAQQAQQGQFGQQGQLGPQGWFGNLLGQVGQPLGGAIGGIFGQSGLGQTLGGAAGQLGRMLPFNADPITAAYAQQAQQAQLQQALQGQQGQQFSPQGWFGNLLGQVGQPLGGAIGGIFGQSGLGQTLGGAAGQLGRMLPFNVDPITAAYAQQAQQAQLQQALQGQQGQQFSPQGWFGNLLGQVGQPLGGAIGGIFGQSGLGQTLGGAAGQLGRMLPFSADPVAAAYAQQAQQALQAQQAMQAQQQSQGQGQQAANYPGYQAGQGMGMQAGNYGGQYIH